MAGDSPARWGQDARVLGSGWIEAAVSTLHCSRLESVFLSPIYTLSVSGRPGRSKRLPFLSSCRGPACLPLLRPLTSPPPRRKSHRPSVLMYLIPVLHQLRAQVAQGLLSFRDIVGASGEDLSQLGDTKADPAGSSVRLGWEPGQIPALSSAPGRPSAQPHSHYAAWTSALRSSSGPGAQAPRPCR